MWSAIPIRQSPNAPPSLRNPGEKLPGDDAGTGVMRPVQFPKPATQPGANPDGEPGATPPAQPPGATQPSVPDASQPAPAKPQPSQPGASQTQQ